MTCNDNTIPMHDTLCKIEDGQDSNMHQTQPRTHIHANWLAPTLRRLWQINPNALRNRGFTMDAPQTWYDLEDWLLLLNDLSQYGMKIVNVGMIAGRTYPFSAVDDVAAALAQLGQDYLTTHSQPNDAWQVCPQGPCMVCVSTRTPYPDEFELGLLQSVAERFAPPQAIVNIQQFHSMPRLVAYNNRTYLINW